MAVLDIDGVGRQLKQAAVERSTILENQEVLAVQLEALRSVHELPKRYMAINRANLRLAPQRGSEVVRVLEPGREATVMARLGRWGYAQIEEDTYGWVHLQNLRLVD